MINILLTCSQEMRKLEPTAIVVFAQVHLIFTLLLWSTLISTNFIQADVGMYLRDEDTLFTT